MVELFAGKARICKMAAWCGFTSRGYDINMCPRKTRFRVKRGMPKRSSMDVNGCAGMLSLVKENTLTIVSVCWVFFASVCKL